MVYASEGKTHSLLIKKAQMNDDGHYTVKAVNEAGETVAKATLTVKGTMMMFIRLTFACNVGYVLHMCARTYVYMYAYIYVCRYMY